jgi:membrane-associated phospholipid phosphatase
MTTLASDLSTSAQRRVRVALALLASVPVLGLLVVQTEAHRADEWLYRTINGLGPGPEWLWTLLDPHTRNYLVLIVLALGAAAVTNLRSIPATFGRVFGSALLAWALLEAVYAVYNRPRPEEVVSDPTLNGHSWAHLNSFPSGHMAITAALAVAIALAFPRLRFALWGYVAAVALTRVFFGAHFPLDVLAGTALGTASAILVAQPSSLLVGLAPLRAALERIGSMRVTPGGVAPASRRP